MHGTTVKTQIHVIVKNTVPGKRQDIFVLWEDNRFLTKLPVVCVMPMTRGKARI